MALPPSLNCAGVLPFNSNCPFQSPVSADRSIDLAYIFPTHITHVSGTTISYKSSHTSLHTVGPSWLSRWNRILSPRRQQQSTFPTHARTHVQHPSADYSCAHSPSSLGFWSWGGRARVVVRTVVWFLFPPSFPSLRLVDDSQCCTNSSLRAQILSQPPR